MPSWFCSWVLVFIGPSSLQFVTCWLFPMINICSNISFSRKPVLSPVQCCIPYLCPSGTFCHITWSYFLSSTYHYVTLFVCLCTSVLSVFLYQAISFTKAGTLSVFSSRYLSSVSSFLILVGTPQIFVEWMNVKQKTHSYCLCGRWIPFLDKGARWATSYLYPRQVRGTKILISTFLIYVLLKPRGTPILRAAWIYHICCLKCFHTCHTRGCECWSFKSLPRNSDQHNKKFHLRWVIPQILSFPQTQPNDYKQHFRKYLGIKVKTQQIV